MPSETCAACIASRKKTVDAFFDGYFAGAHDTANDMVAAEYNQSPTVKDTEFCLEHEHMLTALIIERRHLSRKEPSHG